MAGRCGHDQGAGRAYLRGFARGLGLKAQGAQIRYQSVEPARVTAPGQDAAARCHAAQVVQLHSRLHAGAEHADALHVRGRQVLGRHGAGGRGAQIGQMALVEQHGGGRAVFAIEQQHHALAGWQAAGHVARETRGDLHHVARLALYVAVLDVHLAARLLQDQLPHRRNDCATLGVGYEGLLHGGDEVDTFQDALDLGPGEDAGHGRSRGSAGSVWSGRFMWARVP